MDISGILASHNAKLDSIKVEKETPLDVDAGFLTVADPNPRRRFLQVFLLLTPELVGPKVQITAQTSYKALRETAYRHS
ncbi:Rhodanese-related sulfurtransferase [Stygiomarasmius scandens]|uniref:Rhodanese-related sulfurtransferase n=1 Tax=Marasmiellus scandens TaxID=2682957 RepID=A0ABR1JYK5_9AGAR